MKTSSESTFSVNLVSFDGDAVHVVSFGDSGCFVDGGAEQGAAENLEKRVSDAQVIEIRLKKVGVD